MTNSNEGYDAEQKRNVSSVFTKWSIEKLEKWLKNNPDTPGRYTAMQQAKEVRKILKQKKKETVTEGSYRGDLKRLVEPELHIDQHRSKMGEDDDVIVASFKIQGKEPANDLVSFLETGYDFILDADASPGEISPGKFLVFFELSRRTTATYPFTKENLEKYIPMSPRAYRDSHEEFKAEEPEAVEAEKPAQDTDDIAAMKNIAGIPVNQTAPDDDEMNSLRQQAGLT